MNITDCFNCGVQVHMYYLTNAFTFPDYNTYCEDCYDILMETEEREEGPRCADGS